MKRFRLKVRWWIALAWDRLFPRSCWAETACWAMDYEGKLQRDCASDHIHAPCHGVQKAEGLESCWCGKFQSTALRERRAKP